MKEDLDKNKTKAEPTIIPLLMNASDAAKRLGFCKRLLLEGVEKGEIRAIKRNGRLWFREEYLIEFINKMEKETEEN